MTAITTWQNKIDDVNGQRGERNFATDFVINKTISVINQLTRDKMSGNSKGALQEYCQSHGLPLPIYFGLKRSGVDHSPRFKVSGSIRFENGF